MRAIASVLLMSLAACSDAPVTPLAADVPLLTGRWTGSLLRFSGMTVELRQIRETVTGTGELFSTAGEKNRLSVVGRFTRPKLVLRLTADREEPFHIFDGSVFEGTWIPATGQAVRDDQRIDGQVSFAAGGGMEISLVKAP